MKSLASLILFFLVSTSAVAQFRQPNTADDKLPSAREAMTEPTNFIAELFNMNRWSMHQSYSMSYSFMGGESIGLTMLTNTFQFHAADNLNFSADVSAVYSPFSSLGKEFSNSLNGIYLTSARMDWQLG